MKKSLAAGFFLLLTAVAQAAPQSINDCEKIADPDAYNRCLAAFGPASSAGRNAGKAAPSTATSPEASVPATADVPRSRGRGRYAKRGGRGGKSYVRSRGRVRMEITMGSSSSGKSSRGRRRR